MPALIEQCIALIEERKAAKSRLIAQQQSAKTFEKFALAYVAAKQDEWKNSKHRSQCVNTLRTYLEKENRNRFTFTEMNRIHSGFGYSKGLPYRIESRSLEKSSGYSIAGTI